jgi:hypothetical protein
MSKKEKPLPKPPSTPFGKKRSFEDNENRGPLMAEQMAIAMSQGKLDEFLQKELPDNEHARKLAEMMMGMSGMMPAGGFSGKPAQGTEGSPKEPASEEHGERSPDVQPPEDIINAVQAGDLQGLKGLLAKEHAKRTGGSITDIPDEEKKTIEPSSAEPAVDKEVIDQIMKIASENDLSLDWLFFRALKRYVEEYKKTGKL